MKLARTFVASSSSAIVRALGPRQPGLEAGSRDAQRFAQPYHRPDRTVLRDKAELHIDSFAK
jgi:hypothetical protein